MAFREELENQKHTKKKELKQLCDKFDSDLMHNGELNLEIEDTIELTVQTKDAPELFKSDMEWIATETRASQALFDSEENISLDFDTFDVDGIRVSFHVKRA